MKTRYDTYCGLYCGACDVLLATEQDRLEDTAREWNMNPDDLRCHGCKTGIIAIYCKTCDMRQCAEKKQVDFCFQCTEYPCNRLLEFKNDESPHHSAVIQNLEAIRESGVEKWLEEQRSRWNCPECGTNFTWYDEICTKCGRTLYSCKDEEKDL